MRPKIIRSEHVRLVVRLALEPVIPFLDGRHARMHSFEFHARIVEQIAEPGQIVLGDNDHIGGGRVEQATRAHRRLLHS